MDKLELIANLSEIITLLAEDDISTKDAINNKLWGIWEDNQAWKPTKEKDK
jgi:hypothetical protein